MPTESGIHAGTRSLVVQGEVALVQSTVVRRWLLPSGAASGTLTRKPFSSPYMIHSTYPSTFPNRHSWNLLVIMRTIVILTASLLVSGCGSDSSNSPTSKQAPKTGSGQSIEQEAPVAKAARKTDASQILGTWTSVRFEKDGLVDPTGSGGKAVFEKENAFIHSLPFFSYELDPRQAPKHFSTSSSKAIYRLQGDTLTICMATSSSAPRPTEFATKKNDGGNLIAFKRAYPLDPDAPDAEYDRELSRKIKQGIKLLESERLREFAEWMGQPILDEVLAKGLDKDSKQRMDQLSATLKVLLKVSPKFNSARDNATFDVSGIHIEGGIGHTWWFNYVKRDGKWYPAEDRFPLVE